MPIISCPDCKREISDAAPACPNCGRPNYREPRTSLLDNRYRSPVRPLGTALILGVLAFPIVFAWATLGRGRTTQARVASFGYLIFVIAVFLMQNLPATGLHGVFSPAEPSTENLSQGREEALPVGLEKLLFDYQQNEVAADNRYQGRVVRVIGVVDRVKKDIGDNLYVILGTGGRYQRPSLQAFFSSSMSLELGALRKGDQVTVLCRVTGLMINVLAKECIFAQ